MMYLILKGKTYNIYIEPKEKYKYKRTIKVYNTI